MFCDCNLIEYHEVLFGLLSFTDIALYVRARVLVDGLLNDSLDDLCAGSISQLFNKLPQRLHLCFKGGYSELKAFNFLSELQLDTSKLLDFQLKL